MIELLLLIIFCLLGVATGVLTGLLPGLHVNNVALILLSASAGIVAFCSPIIASGISEEFIYVLIAGYVISVSTSHSFHDVLPTTFIGAPDEDNALSVLPAHSFLLEGKGYQAIAYSALGSYGAIVVCLGLLYLIRFIIGVPLNLYNTLNDIMFYVLLAITILMLGTEKTQIPEHKNTPSSYLTGTLFALFVFLLSGIFGHISLEMSLTSPFGLDASVLFPTLAGLFGMPTLLTSLLEKPNIPPQKIENPTFNSKEKKDSILSVITGSLAGILVSIIPGITSSTGTILAMNARQASGKDQTIMTLSAVNTASAFSVIVVLFIILRPRSGAALAVSNLIVLQEWTQLSIPLNLTYLLIFIILSGGLSYFSTLLIGKTFAKKFVNVPYVLLVSFTILLVTGMVAIFTGILGLYLLLTATIIGFLPIHWGVRRSHCMGFLLIPIMLYFFPGF